MAYGEGRGAAPNGWANRKQPMSFRQHFSNSVLPASLSRAKSSEAVERAWVETVAGPLDPLRDSDLLHATAHGHEVFALTMPMGLSAR
jgi:hypothetical protein